MEVRHLGIKARIIMAGLLDINAESVIDFSQTTMLLNDTEILKLCEEGMIRPYYTESVRKVGDTKVISYGVSSYGYDIRLDYEDIRVFQHVPGRVVNPKAFDEMFLRESHRFDLRDEGFGSGVILPAHTYLLGNSVEMFVMPDDVIATCLGKSTYARCGVAVNVTPLEPGWTGYLTIEVYNSSDSDVYIYTGEGIAQLMFFRGNKPEVTYANRQGKYQRQPRSITLPKV